MATRRAFPGTVSSMEPGLSSPGTSPRRGRSALWLGKYGLLRPRKQQSQEFRAAFAVDDPVDLVGAEPALKGDHRLLLIGNIIAEPLEREQEARVGPIRVDEVARRTWQSEPAPGQRFPRKQFAGVLLARGRDV